METALKQRLVGAMVLVALAVIFLPMLIKGPAPESGVANVPLDPPAAPEDGFETRELPLVTPSADAASGVLPAATAPAHLPTVEAGAQADSAMLPPATAGGGYAVGFGSYASQTDAARVIAALAASQLPGYQEPVTTSGGRTLHRVRIGPYATQADAEAARLRAAHVRDDVGAKVVVLDAAPASETASTAAPAPAAATPAAGGAAQASAAPAVKPAAVADAPRPAAQPGPAKPKQAEGPATKPEVPRAGAAGVGFAVQLGAFGNAGEAAKLRERARAAGFTAFVEQVQTDKGTLNRVRIGPVADRAEADRLRERAAARLGISGLVRPHP
jgi:cell division septation protein DedD